MRLKQIILHGFKSFADRTVFRLEGRGMTCIVGPNGCGKSNVIDATKWILGEQRPTSLRGKEMTDVIFNGTVRRPPMGLCEGTLVFDNTLRTLPSDEDEVRITRRVFRSGETEYHVNGRPCRLKDVRDLLAGTGLGHGGYGFMEQGKIDSILASNPVERRKVFEEASGISKFRQRKHEAELKLGRVEENLSRVGDIVEEIDRQVRSLKIQAGKARNHREMTDRARELQIAFNRHRYHTLEREQGEIGTELESLLARRDEIEVERDAVREVVREQESDLAAWHERVAEGRSNLAALTGQKRSVEQRGSFADERRRETSSRRAAREAEIAEAESRLSGLAEDRLVTQRDRDALRVDVAQSATLRQAKEVEVAAERESAAKLRSACEDAERRTRSSEASLNELLRHEARREADKAHGAQRQGFLDQRQSVLAGERERLAAAIRDRSAQQASQTDTLEQRRGELTEEERRSEGLDSAYGKSQEELAALDSDLSRRRARREVLRGLLQKGEGLEHGTRRLLDQRRKDPSFLPGFVGLLHDLIETDVAHARAVEGALGDLVSAIVVQSIDDVRAALAFLVAQNLGGVRLIALDRFSPCEASALPDGILAAHEAMLPVLGALLEGLAIVPAAEFESRLGAGTGGPFLVADDGHVLRKTGLLEVPRRGNPAPGLVVLQAELRELERVIPSEEQQVAALREGVAALRRDRDDSRARTRELSVALLSEEGAAARLDQEIVRMVRELERLDGESEHVASDREKLRVAMDQLAGDLERLTSQRTSGRAAVEEAAAELERCRERFAGAGQRLEEVQRDLAATRVEETRFAERLAALESRERQLLESSTALQRRLDAAREELVALFGDSESLETVAREAAREAERLVGLLREAEQRVSEDETGAKAARELARGSAEQLEDLEHRAASLAELLASHRGREGELRAAVAALLDRTRSEIEGDPLELLAAEATLEEPEGGWAHVESEIKDLRGRIVRLGNVNLAAVEELDAAEQRAEFLSRERADLDAAREELRKILKDIEARSSGLFLETFNAVREHFSVIFRRLFGGGKAEIVLEDPSRPLESGIEIRARPPGKELRSITLLSGGERTMTAVSLLFAIFRSNPAPCAFLDEVDAALDEDNIDRFCTLLDEFVGQSQFIIVSHSRRTMERADLLLGITMPERGVSRPVAVELQQVADDGSIDPRAAAAAAAQAEADAREDLPMRDSSEESPPPSTPNDVEDSSSVEIASDVQRVAEPLGAEGTDPSSEPEQTPSVDSGEPLFASSAEEAESAPAASVVADPDGITRRSRARSPTDGARKTPIREERLELTAHARRAASAEEETGEVPAAPPTGGPPESEANGSL